MFDARNSFSNEAEEPNFEGYQLIGDSQFLRFSERLLNWKRKAKNGLYHLGFCVSGQKISELLRRVQNGFADVTEKVILMIGTNDLLRDTSFEDMRKDLTTLLALLLKRARKIILLTIPPVPKLKGNRYHWDRLKKYNAFIRQCGNGRTIFVGDAYAELTLPEKSPARNHSKSFESDFSSPSTKENSANRNRSPKSRINQDPPEVISSQAQSLGRQIKNSCLLKRLSWDSPEPPEQEGPIGQKNSSERRRSIGSKSGYKNGQVSENSRRVNRLASSSTGPAAFAQRAFGGFVRSLKTSSGGDGLLSRATQCARDLERRCSTNSSSSTIAETRSTRESALERRRSTTPSSSTLAETRSTRVSALERIRSTTPSSSTPAETRSTRGSSLERRRSTNSSSSTPSKTWSTRGSALESNCDSSYYPTTSSSGCYDSPRILANKAFTPKKNCNSSYCPTTPTSGYDSFEISSSTPSNSRCASRSPSLDGDDSWTRSLIVTFERSSCNLSTSDDDMHTTPSRRTPTPKRKRNSFAEDSDIENAEKVRVREDCFEKYFSQDSKRPDQIHLNAKGLCVIKGIIERIIYSVD